MAQFPLTVNNATQFGLAVAPLIRVAQELYVRDRSVTFGSMVITTCTQVISNTYRAEYRGPARRNVTHVPPAQLLYVF